MNKVHFWLIGFGVGALLIQYVMDFPYGAVGIGLPGGALLLGVRQWFMADAHSERQSGAFSNTGVGASYDKYHYHEID